MDHIRAGSGALILTLACATQVAAQSVIPGPGTSTAIQGELQSAVQTPPQQTTAALVEFICPPGNLLSSDLQTRCNEIAIGILGSRGQGGDLGGALAGLQGMAPEENSVIQTIEVDGAGSRDEEVRQRLERRRKKDQDTGAVTMTLNGRPLPPGEVPGAEHGGGASADYPYSGRWGVFLNGNFGFGDKDDSARETGFRTDSYGVTGGADYQLTDQSIVGLALGYTRQDTDLNADSGFLETDSVSVTAYASYFPSARSYVNAILSYGHNDHDQKLTIAYTIASPFTPTGTAVINQSALSDTTSRDLGGSLEGGYDFVRGNWTLTPYGRLNVADSSIDGYTEHMSDPGGPGSGLALQIEDQSFMSITTAFGGRLTTVYSGKRFDLFPQVGAEYVHEFDNDNEDTRGRLVDDTSGSIFLLPTDSPDRNYGNVTAALTADFRNGWSGHVLYQGLVGYEDLNLNLFEIGARLQF